MKSKRKAVAMIELIFAIVVMGIAILSIPMITTQSARSGESAIMQESIAAVAAQMQMIMSLHWDENDANASLGSPILQTQSPNFITKAGLNTSGRPDKSITGITLNASSVADFADFNDNDIDDHNGITTTLTLIEPSTTSIGDYIDININIASSVKYIGDTIALAPTTTFNYNPIGPGVATTTNIKSISVTLTSTEPTFANKDINLNAFSCNIGAVTPNKTGQ